VSETHTPLPWRYERQGHVQRFIVGTKIGWNGMVADMVVGVSDAVSVKDGCILPTDEIEANARLIAAAVNAYPEFEAMRTAMAGLVSLVERYKVMEGANGDWACAECRPTSDIISPGFQCSYHAAKAALKLADARGEGEK
jgi:hypothetical protein